MLPFASQPLARWHGWRPRPLVAHPLSGGQQWYEVVGAVGSVRSHGLAAAVPLEFYQTLEQASRRRMTVVLHAASGEPEKLIPAARQIVASLDLMVPITAVQTMDAVVASSVGQPRLLTALASLFGPAAGLLAMVGVYGVVA